MSQQGIKGPTWEPQDYYEQTSVLYWEAIGWYAINDARQGPSRGDIEKLRADLQVMAFDAYEAERRVRDLLQDPGVLWEACRRSRACPEVEKDVERTKSPLCAWATMFDLQPLHPNEVGDPREATCGCGVLRRLPEEEAP
jgi:hypothetical protein